MNKIALSDQIRVIVADNRYAFFDDDLGKGILDRPKKEKEKKPGKKFPGLSDIGKGIKEMGKRVKKVYERYNEGNIDPELRPPKEEITEETEKEETAVPKKKPRPETEPPKAPKPETPKETVKPEEKKPGFGEKVKKWFTEGEPRTFDDPKRKMLKPEKAPEPAKAPAEEPESEIDPKFEPLKETWMDRGLKVNTITKDGLYTVVRGWVDEDRKSVV